MSDYEEGQVDVSAFFDHGADSATFDQATDSVGLPDDPSVDQPLPNHIADQIEDYDRHQVEKDLEPEEFVEEEPQQQKGSGKVPIGALQEERAKRKEAQDRASALEQQLALQQQQMQQWQAQMQAAQLAQQQQVQQEAIPDFDEDPRGHVEAVKAQFQQELQSIQYQQQYQQAAVQLQQAQQQLAPVVAEAEAAFAESVGVENYRTAFDAVHQAVQANMRMAHPNVSPQEMALIAQATNVQFVRQCQAQGINPAEHIYNLAVGAGLVPAVPGQRVPDTRLPPKAPTSLSTLSAHGRAPDQQGTYKAKDIASLSNEEFDKVFNSMRDGSVAGPAF